MKRQRDGGESQRKVVGQKGEPARSHLCGIQALLPQAVAAQRPQPLRAWPGRVPAGTPSLCPSVRQCARSSQHGHRPSAGEGAVSDVSAAPPAYRAE